MAHVYVLYSKSIDRFYIGSCDNLESRLSQHRNRIFRSAFTRRADDWVLFLSIDNLTYAQSRKIERHIKRMKSRKYLTDLKSYPELVSKLIQKYI